MNALAPMPAVGLTPRQSQVLAFLDEYLSREGEAPSQEEIAKAIGLRAKSGVKRIIDALVERGHVRRLPGKSRSLIVVKQEGAEVHLRRILDFVSVNRSIAVDHPFIQEAHAYLGVSA